MPNTTTDDLDTSALRADQLSLEEWKILAEIEHRLSKASLNEWERRQRRSITAASGRSFAVSPLATAEDRYQRVLLLDGARGTGKTSLVLTFLKRWHGAAGVSNETPWDVDEQHEKRLRDVKTESGITPGTPDAPRNVRVIRNLDFDPLPHEMPLIAGIVQAWRPLAEYYDQQTFPNDELCDDDSGRLMDSWHSLFRVAAVGWSDVSNAKGLIEQVLDREEQVRDWQDIREKYVQFVDEVIAVGRCLKTPERLVDPPVFVVVIDDVDLQVERIHELLPALRLLAHENVFFLVAADQAHMLDMLKLDFLGQQQRLAGARLSQSSLVTAELHRWAPELANAAFEKVFPTKNRWFLSKLSLSDLLDYPHALGDASRAAATGNQEASTLCEILDDIKPAAAKETTVTSTAGAAAEEVATEQQNTSKPEEKPQTTNAGAVIKGLADAAKSVSLVLPALSYRSTQQLWQAVSVRPKKQRGSEVLARLLSSADSAATVLGDGRTIEVPMTGELTALYRPGLADPGEYNVIVSAKADFLYVSPESRVTAMRSRDRHFDFTAGLIAKTLEALEFPIDAIALSWQTYLTLAWTTWPTQKVQGTFAWNWHKHPRPDELLQQTKLWSDYLSGVREMKNIRERHAYAWIYFERQRSANPTSATAPTALPETGDLPWSDILNFDTKTADDVALKDRGRWRTETLPLLARPEIGLPRHVQEKLLDAVKHDSRAKADLKSVRRRLVTDAVFVSDLQRGKVPDVLPTDDVIEGKILHIETRYAALNGRTPSPWHDYIEAATEPSSSSAGAP